MKSELPAGEGSPNNEGKDFKSLLPHYLNEGSESLPTEIVQNEQGQAYLDGIMEQFTPDPPEIVCFLSPEELDKYSTVLAQWLPMLSRLDQDVGINVLSNLDRYSRDTGRNISNIKGLVQKGNLHRPTFQVYGFEEAEQFCSEHGLSKPERNALVVTFQLPKPLATYWQKGTGEWGLEGHAIGGTFIEWGSIYRDTMYIVWDHLGTLGAKNYRRLNDNSKHDRNSYYYVWQTAPLPDTFITTIQDHSTHVEKNGTRKDPQRVYKRSGGKQDHGTKTTAKASRSNNFRSDDLTEPRNQKATTKKTARKARRVEDRIATLQGLVDYEEQNAESDEVAEQTAN